MLFDREIVALRIPDYCSRELCSLIAGQLRTHPFLEVYSHELREGGEVKYLDYGVDRFGVSFNTTYSCDSTAIKRYYDNARKSMQTVRDVCEGALSPFDRFRLELDEVWPGKTGLASFEGKKMMAGVVRVMNRPDDTERLSAQPHVDFLPSTYKHLAGQFAVNIYVEMPPGGGTLELWDVPITEQEMKSKRHDHDWRSELPSSTMILPQTGDLLIFSTRSPHAVEDIYGGSRISIQSFIGLTAEQDLLLWA